MKKGLFLLIVFFFLKFSFAQQDKQFTHYIFDKMSFNPASTGFNGYCATLIYRNQWDRVERAPNTSLLNVQGNFPKQNLGVGISLANDAIGFQRNNSVILNGAYHLNTNAGVLSGGIGIGLINVGFSPIWIPPQTYLDPNLPMPLAGTGFDMNLGLHWYAKNRPYYVGISTTHLVPPSLQIINYQVSRHYYILAGYNFKLAQFKNVEFRPSMLIKSDGATAVFDVNVLADIWLNYYSYLWGGFSYRYSDAIAFKFGYAFSPANNARVNMMKIGYSFDVMTNPLNTYGKGTHELMLNFCIFPPPPVIEKHSNPFILQ